jgi:predicted DNA-binding transcriptional regulator YafY
MKSEDHLEEENAKHWRVLDLCLRLMGDEVLVKSEEAERYHVSERSIQRDLDDLRAFFAERTDQHGVQQELIYDYKLKGYRIRRTNTNELTNGEALAVSKILLESRAFTKKEIKTVLDKIIQGCVPKCNAGKVKDLVSNEEFYYIPTHNSRPAVDKIWELGCAIREQKLITVQYVKQNGSLVQRTLKPVGLLFSEFYFYLLAFIKDIEKDERVADKEKLYPTFYRVDRINGLQVSEEHFEVPYKDRFKEGEFRKRIQFMYGGELRKVRFQYSGPNVEAVLDRLPTAEIEKEENGVYTIHAEVFGDGIDMWLRSQGNSIKSLP